MDVTEERSVRDDAASIEVAERGLRASDLIVAMMDEGGLDSANFWFEYGIAIAGNKGFLAVLAPSIDHDDLPVPIRGGRFVIKGDPDETAAHVAARYAERRTA